MKRLLLLLPVLLLAAACTPNPFIIEQVNPHLYRFPQPTTAAQWDAVRAKGVTSIVKLNDEAEGSDDGGRARGILTYELALDPRGDGPIYAQADSVFKKPDMATAIAGLAVACDPGRVTGIHCTHAWDRTGFEVALERVLCEGWTPAAAHEEWHRKAHYMPYGDRIPAPGLEAAWDEFVDSRGP